MLLCYALFAGSSRVTELLQVGFERSATRDDVRVTLSLETLEEVRDAGSITRVNSNSHVSKVRRRRRPQLNYRFLVPNTFPHALAAGPSGGDPG